MKKLLFTAILIVPVTAVAELPTRKPGLWEITVTSPQAGPQATTMKQCIDQETDAKMMQMGTDMVSQMGGSCAKNEIRKQGSDYVGESDCTLSGSRIISKSVFSGDFNSAYTAEMRATYDPPMMGMKEATSKMRAKWLGECAAGQKPGDMILPNGMSMNMKDIPKMGAPQNQPR